LNLPGTLQFVKQRLLQRASNCCTNNLRHLGRPSAVPPAATRRYPARRLFENPEKRRGRLPPAPSDPPAGDVGAIFTGRRGVGNAVCRNFLFPLGWPACGVNSSLPPRYGGLRNFDAPRPLSALPFCPASSSAARRGALDGSGRGTSSLKRLGNGAHTTAALPPTVPDQMTRASAHNNGLFTPDSIPRPRPGTSVYRSR